MYTFTPETVEQQFKEITIQGIDYNQKTFVESMDLFNIITNNAYSLHTQKAVESVKTFNQCMKAGIEKTQITKLFGNTGKN
jgi:hypothetical protein